MSPTMKLQDIPPNQARFCLNVERFTVGELGVEFTGKTILVGFSGGVDSIVLLTVLAALSPRLRCTVKAAHLDHGLRAESKDEARAARRFCDDLGIECLVDGCDVGRLAEKSGLGLEEAARDARYAFLSQAKTITGSDILALGHQLNDLAEDVLMRLTRGSGWPQLGGMRAWDEGKRLVRPLLLTPRKDIEDFARALSLPWIDDPSNADPSFLRNRMRHSVLPLFLKENPNFLGQVAAQWRIARLDRDHNAQEAAALIVKAGGDGTFLPASLLNDCSPAQRLRLFKAVLDRLGPGQALADSLFRLERAWNDGNWGAAIQFPGPKQADVGAKGVTFGSGSSSKNS